MGISVLLETKTLGIIRMVYSSYLTGISRTYWDEWRIFPMPTEEGFKRKIPHWTSLQSKQHGG